jgi:hypothetical protein
MGEGAADWRVMAGDDRADRVDQAIARERPHIRRDILIPQGRREPRKYRCGRKHGDDNPPSQRRLRAIETHDRSRSARLYISENGGIIA